MARLSRLAEDCQSRRVNVFRTLPERWDFELDDAQPIQKVSAETLSSDLLVQIAIGRRD
jgi:hypothetical protein